MAGRPITNHSQSARRKRERMRKLREARKVMEQRPVFNPIPLTQVLQNWRTQ